MKHGITVGELRQRRRAREKWEQLRAWAIDAATRDPSTFEHQRLQLILSRDFSVARRLRVCLESDGAPEVPAPTQQAAA